MRWGLAGWTLVGMTSGFLNCGAYGQEWVARAARVDTPPTIDGRWEGVWDAAPAITGFRQFRPARGEVADKETEVHILYDDRALYVGWICYEDDPRRLVACAGVRDMWMNDDDCIDFMWDANNDRQTAYDFMVNWRGVQYDGQVTRDGAGGGPEWDGEWEAATSVGEEAWYCEMAIPWSTVRYERTASSFGIQLLRFRKPVYEETFWASDGSYLNRVSSFGRLEGFAGLPRPNPLILTPYVTGRAGRRWDSEAGGGKDSGGWEIDPRCGGDVELRLGAGTSVVGTVWPDYAYVEADPASISLEPTETYLDEKRPFFTEGGEYFETQRDFFYSRRLTEIGGGVKYLGRGGRVSYAVADVLMGDEDPTYPEDNICVGRATVDTKGGAAFGLMAINRTEWGVESPGDPGVARDRARYNNVAVADGRINCGSDYYVRYEAARSATAGEGGEGYVWNGAFGRGGISSNGVLWYAETSRDLRCDTSFVQPEDLDCREVGGEVLKELQVNRRGVRAVRLYATHSREWRLGGERRAFFSSPAVRINAANDWFANVNYRGGWDARYVGQGYPAFANDVFDVDLGRAPAAWGAVRVGYWRGMWYGAYYHYYTLELDATPFPALAITTDTEIANRRGDGRCVVVNAKLTHNFLPQRFWRLLLRHDGGTRLSSAALLGGWDFREGSTAYLAFEQKRDDSGGHFRIVEEVTFLKISYQL